MRKKISNHQQRYHFPQKILLDLKMPFRCAICSYAFSANGTEHALCSTKCGHLVGKSCLEKWINENNADGEFKCPVCRQSVRDYFPIFDVPNELFQIALNGVEDKCQSEDDLIRRCALGTLKEKHVFIRQDAIEIKDMYESNIQFFDAFNGYIMIAGHCLFDYDLSVNYDNDFLERTYFLKIYKDGCLYYNKEFKGANITAVALNKCSEDSLEFSVGLGNGIIHNAVFSLSNGVHGTPHETILFNGKKRISSICYLGYKDIVYSIEDYGGSNIFNLHIDCIHGKKNWLKNIDVKLNTITKLTVIDDCTLFGIMDGKIYVFEKKRIPYEVYSEKCMEFMDFNYDSLSKMMLINRLRTTSRSRDFETTKPILVGIKKNYTFETEGCRRGTYISYTIGNFQGDSCIAQSFLTSLSNFTYTFLPYYKDELLRAYFVNRDGLIEHLGEEEIDYLYECSGIVALNKPQFFTSKMIKIPIVIIFGNEFLIYNFYTSIERVESERL